MAVNIFCQSLGPSSYQGFTVSALNLLSFRLLRPQFHLFVVQIYRMEDSDRERNYEGAMDHFLSIPKQPMTYRRKVQFSKAFYINSRQSKQQDFPKFMINILN